MTYPEELNGTGGCGCDWAKSDHVGLARFVDPRATRWLRPDLAPFDVEPSASGRLDLIRSLYDQLAGMGIRYAHEEWHPDERCQTVRPPRAVVDQPGLATCLDVATTFAGVCLGLGLLPVVAITERHALVLVSLRHGADSWQSFDRVELGLFSSGPLTDADALRELVDSGDYVAIETTGMTAARSLPNTVPEGTGRVDGLMSFDVALQAGRHRLDVDDDAFRFAIDVAATHASGIGPQRICRDHRRVVADDYVLSFTDAGARADRRQVAAPDLHRLPPAQSPPPRRSRGLIGRQREQEFLRSGEPGGLTGVWGESGLGKSELLRWLAFEPAGESGRDGSVYLRHDGSGVLDLLHETFERCYESGERVQLTMSSAARHLGARRLRVLIDDLHLPPADVGALLDVLAGSSVVATSSGPESLSEGSAMALTPLSIEDAISLFERESGQDLTVDVERISALFAELGTSPRSVSSIARAVAVGDVTMQQLFDSGPDGAPVEDGTRVATILRAAYPSFVPRRVLGGSSDRIVDEELDRLCMRERAECVDDRRYRWAVGAAGVPRPDAGDEPALLGAVNRWLADEPSPDDIVEAGGLLVHSIGIAATAERWGDVVRIAGAVEPWLAIGNRWDAWRSVLGDLLSAARTTSDDALEAYCHHQLGTRALGLGEMDAAAAELERAHEMRERSGDHDGAAVTRHNLDLARPPATGAVGRVRDLVRRYPVPSAIVAILIAVAGVVGIAQLAGGDGAESDSDGAGQTDQDGEGSSPDEETDSEDDGETDDDESAPVPTDPSAGDGDDEPVVPAALSDYPEYDCILRDSCLDDDPYSAGHFGHPNIRTWDGVSYAFHGAGDYVFATADDGWEVQVRYSRLANMRRVSYVRALAVRVGDQVVTVGDSPDRTIWDGAQLRVDGEVVEIPAGQIFELDSGIIYFGGSRWLILDDQERAAIAGNQIGQAHEFRMPRWQLWDSVRGLAGTPDADPTNDLRSAGDTSIDPALFEQLYGEFGESWLVDPADSFFETPLNPVDDQPIFPEAALLLSDFDEEIRRQAENVCRNGGIEPGRGLNECMFDLVLTGDARWADATSAVASLSGDGVHWRLIDPRIDDDREIELGDEIVDELQTTGAHQYRFSAGAGDRVVLRLTEPCGDDTPTTLVAGFRGPDGFVTESIALTDCGDSKPLVIDDDGDYALLVTDEQGLSTAFGFQLLAATDQDKGTLAVGDIASDEFVARSDVHSWRIDVGNNPAFSVNAIDVPCDATWVVERDGEPIWVGDACTTSPPIVAGGELRVLLVAEFASTYEFELFEVPEPLEQDLPADGAVAGTIGEPGASAIYYVEVGDGQLVELFSDTESCDLGRVLLDAPSDDTFQGRELCRDSGPYELPETGRWGVRIDPPGDATGDYAFRFVVVKDTRLGGSASAGELIEGTINSPGESVSFDFDAAPATRFQVIAAGTECGFSRLFLEGTDGGVYSFADLCSDHIIRVGSAGLARLIVDPSDEQTGAFAFRLVEVVTQRSELEFERVLQGSIDTVGGRYVYRLTVPDGGLGLQVVATGTPCGLSEINYGRPDATSWRVGNDLCEDTTISISDPGQYELFVDPGGLETGRFSFRVFEIVEPTPIPLRLGAPVRGELTTPGEYAVYSLTTTVDDAEFAFTAGGDDCDFSQAFFRPLDGESLRYFGNLCEDHTIRLGGAGEWAIVIDPSDSTIGTYEFTLDAIG